MPRASACFCIIQEKAVQPPDTHKAGKKLLKKIKKIEVQVALDKSFRQIVADRKIGKKKWKLKLRPFFIADRYLRTCRTLDLQIRCT